MNKNAYLGILWIVFSLIAIAILIIFIVLIVAPVNCKKYETLCYRTQTTYISNGKTISPIFIDKPVSCSSSDVKGTKEFCVEGTNIFGFTIKEDIHK